MSQKAATAWAKVSLDLLQLQAERKKLDERITKAENVLESHTMALLNLNLTGLHTGPQRNIATEHGIVQVTDEGVTLLQVEREEEVFPKPAAEVKEPAAAKEKPKPEPALARGN